jgi:hypothetical protein
MEMTPAPVKFHIMNTNVTQSIGRLYAFHMYLQMCASVRACMGTAKRSDGREEPSDPSTE